MSIAPIKYPSSGSIHGSHKVAVCHAERSEASLVQPQRPFAALTPCPSLRLGGALGGVTLLGLQLHNWPRL
jgi:hypothetical protein